jgi:glycosyltransferase involved in cell wall biosynthesis
MMYRTQKMNMVVNAVPLLNTLTGIGRYTSEIATRLPKEWDVYYYKGFISRYPPIPKPSMQNIIQRSGIAKKIVRKVLYSLPSWREFELYWEPNFIPNRKIRSKKVVTTLHDFSIFRYPQWHPKDRVEFFTKSFWDSIERSDHFITVSHSIKKEAIKLLGLPEEKVSVIYNGVDHTIFRPLEKNITSKVIQKYHLPQDFLLYVGSIEPRKNLLHLLQAYDRLPEPLKKEYPLVLAGFRGWNNKQIMELVKKNRVYYVGYLPLEDLVDIYNHATLLLYLSFYEGFGIPPLEAMACGTPVILSDIEVFKEIYKEGALFCDPYSPDDIAHSIYSVLTDHTLLAQLSRAALNYAQKFSWENSAQEHATLFRALIERG